MHNFSLSPELNLSPYAAAGLKDSDHLPYFSQEKLKPEIFELRLVISAMLIAFLSFLTLTLTWLAGEKLIREHHLKCTVHPNIN